MIELEHAKLKEILKKINTNPQTRQQYSSKLYRILNFLNSNTGLKNAAVKDAGSRAKQTETWNSDLDVIFCTSTNEDHQKIRKHILVKAKEAFNAVADVKLGKKAVKVAFKSPKISFDLVYMTQQQFKVETKKIKKIRRIRPLHKNAIKLAKFAINKAGLNSIKSYEVELACLTFKYNNLVDCTTHLINYFKGRINQKGLSVDRVLKYLT